MPRVPLRYVLSFNSQDARHPVENLLQEDGSRRWLCAPGFTGHLEVVFQLDRQCCISHLDIGTWFTFSAEVLVGRSTLPMDQDFVPLLPTATFMNPQDCRKGKNKTSIRMFKKNDFVKNIAEQKWDRVKLICSQPFQKEQFGVSLLRILTDEELTTESSHQESRNISSIATPSQSSASPQFSKDIHNHFFGANATSSSKSQLEKSCLKNLNLFASSNGESDLGASPWSRNAKMVLAAASSNTPKYKVPKPDHLDVGSTPDTARKKKVPFSTEIDRFFDTLNTKNLDLETLTFADIRHRFEKQKLRKLSKEEKKLFFQKCQSFIEKLSAAVPSRQNIERNSSATGASASAPVKIPATQNNSPKSLTQKNDQNVSCAARLGSDVIPPGEQLRCTSISSEKPFDKMNMAEKEPASCTVSQHAESKIHENLFPTKPISKNKDNFASVKSVSKAKKSTDDTRLTGDRGSMSQYLKNLSPLRRTSEFNDTLCGVESKSTKGKQQTKPKRGKKRKRSVTSLHAISLDFTDDEAENEAPLCQPRAQNEALLCQPRAENEAPACQPRAGTVTLCGPVLVECPLCGSMFSQHQIEVHAAQCGQTDLYSSSTVASVAPGECPVCLISFPLDILPFHVDTCLGS